MSTAIIQCESNPIELRNTLWGNNPYIPRWVNIDSVGLDQFFTKKNIAKKYYHLFLDFLKQENVNVDEYTFVEPSAGNGSFFNLLPKNSRIGLDLMPLNTDIEQKDFLAWNPKKQDGKYIFIGNPPFGYRAWLALVFMNHVAKFGDYAGFILPMAFQSDGKGSPKHRVNGMKLIHSEIIPTDSFYTPQNKPVKINALWQIWKKGNNIIPEPKTCRTWLDLFTVDFRKERLCGQNKIENADYFLQRTFYSEPPKLVTCFSKVKYTCGYGLIIKKDKDRVLNILNRIDWMEYSNLAAHNCRHISMYHIEKVLVDNGLYDV